MKHFLPVAYFFCSLLLGAFAARAAPADWTLMIYMNGKNNLEPDALLNFAEIAAVGSSDAVNVLVEMGRPKHHASNDPKEWSGVIRYRVKKGDVPVPPGALDLRRDALRSDMGSPLALADFIDWSIERYPAKKYMVVIWNHGQGWRFQMADDIEVKALAARSELATAAARVKVAPPVVGGFRAASFDDDTGHFLFNSDIQGVLQRKASKMNRKFDIVGFDACLMAMVETAYSLRNSTPLMVASEELEPGEGWNYELLIRELVAHPEMSAVDLGKKIVSVYSDRYGLYHDTTMSLLDLTKAEPAAHSLSDLAAALMATRDRRMIERVRSQLRSFGASDGQKTSIDVVAFSNALATSATEPLKSSSTKAAAAVRDMILANYASQSDHIKSTGAQGVAIYFPGTKDDYVKDPYGSGYRKDNADHVVDFVKDQKWADFIAKWVH